MTQRSGYDLLHAVARGAVEPPASDAFPAVDRWRWFADLYAHPAWGLVSVIPSFPQIAAGQVAAACRATAARTATPEQWGAVKVLAHAGLETTQTRALALVWSAVSDTCTDAADHLDGLDFGGLEAVLGAVEAVLHQHTDPVAAAFFDSACAAWNRRAAAPVRSVA